MKIKLLEEKKEEKRCHLTLPYKIWTRIDDAILLYQKLTNVELDIKQMAMLLIEAGLNDKEFWNQLQGKKQKPAKKVQNEQEEAA